MFPHLWQAFMCFFASFHAIAYLASGDSAEMGSDFQKAAPDRSQKKVNTLPSFSSTTLYRAAFLFTVPDVPASNLIPPFFAGNIFGFAI